MRKWNTATVVVENVLAETPEEAQAALDAKVRDLGFQVYEDNPYTPFESDEEVVLP